jgi:hypothetical protein
MTLRDPRPDRTVLVTGASSGIGEAIARDLAARGHGLTLVARRAERLEALAEDLTDTGVRIEVLPTDLTDRGARAALPARVEALGLALSALVNNAGLSTTGPVHRGDPDAELRMIEVDVVALADLCTRFLPAMVDRGEGGVLNVASTAAFQPLPGQAAYGACKAFVLSYTRSLSGELRGTGVSASALCPGPVRTEFADVAGFAEQEAEGSVPSFMWESPQDVARVGVDALCSGRTVAIPGLPNRIGATAAALAPKDLLVPVLARLHPALRR